MNISTFRLLQYSTLIPTLIICFITDSILAFLLSDFLNVFLLSVAVMIIGLILHLIDKKQMWFFVSLPLSVFPLILFATNLIMFYQTATITITDEKPIRQLIFIEDSDEVAYTLFDNSKTRSIKLPKAEKTLLNNKYQRSQHCFYKEIKLSNPDIDFIDIRNNIDCSINHQSTTASNDYY